MMYCDKCRVHLTGERNRCPLCGKVLRDEKTENPALYPVIPVRISYNLIFKISTFVAIVCILVLAILNFTFLPHLSLYIPLTISTFCCWLIVNIGYQKRKNIPRGILYEALISLSLCFLWDYLTDWRGWSLNFVLPISTAALNVFYFLMSLIDRRNATAYGIYLCISMIGTIVTAVLFFLDVFTFNYIAAFSVGIGLSLFCFLLIFRWRTFTSELSSRFHI